MSGVAYRDNMGITETVIIDTDNQKIPDVKGMGARDAVFLLESAGIKVEVNGKGKVRKQSLPAGSKAVRGSKCIIDLG